MRTYKWLGTGGRDQLTGREWSTDRWVSLRKWRSAHRSGTATGTWQYSHTVEPGSLAEANQPPPSGLSAAWLLRMGGLVSAYSPLDSELWEVELKGGVQRDIPAAGYRPSGPTAKRGRLVSRVEEWTDEVAAELARAWILRARDDLAEALRAAGGRDAEHAGRLAAAERRAEIQAVAEEVERDDSAANDLVAGTSVNALWQAVNAVKHSPPGASAARAAEARALAVAARRAAEGAGVATAWEAARAERARISGELGDRLGIDASPEPAPELPVRVPTPFSAALLAWFVIGIGIVLAALGPALIADRNLEVEPPVGIGIGLGGIAVVLLALGLMRLARSVRRRRWLERSSVGQA